MQESEEDTIMVFPCRFPIKVMGLAETDFDVLVYDIVRQHAPGLSREGVTSRSSQAGKYVSVTVTVEAESRQQLDNIYMDLTAHKKGHHGVMTIKVIDLGIRDYPEVYDRMRRFNAERRADTADQIWLLEHPPVYTLGLSDDRTHLLKTGTIPVINTDRGGQVTYHGPGQLIAYLLLNLEKKPYRVKQLVSLVEQAVIDYLATFQIRAERKSGAPGVYVNGEKMAALGIRVRRGSTYHGLSLNVDMDLAPYKGINPCGYAGLTCTQLKHHVSDITLPDVKKTFPRFLIKRLEPAAGIMTHAA